MQLTALVMSIAVSQIPADLITMDPKQLTGLDDADQEVLAKEKLEREVCVVIVCVSSSYCYPRLMQL